MAKQRKRFHVKTDGKQAFNVPNNDEGREFLRLAKKFANYPAMSMRKHGRAQNRLAAFERVGRVNSSAWERRCRVPLAGAEWIALYIVPISYHLTRCQ